MTALARYRRLEATGLWRETPEDQRREVLVTLGDASLTISALNETALSHWSIPAVVRLNPGKDPALYAPGDDSSEQLELSDADMIDAIETLRTAIERRRPRPGRVRFWIALGAALVGLSLAVLWLPTALTRQTVALLPEASRAEIGERLLAEVIRISGQPCVSQRGQVALTRLATRSLGTGAPNVVILPTGIPDTIALPGNIIVARATLVEDHETAEVLAGYLVAEQARAEAVDPLLHLLEENGLATTFSLLTTGHLDEATLHEHAAHLLSRPRPAVPAEQLLPAFAEARISTQPYAFALDVSGETSIDLIEADPMRSAETTEPLLTDSDWISLQEICAR